MEWRSVDYEVERPRRKVGRVLSAGDEQEGPNPILGDFYRAKMLGQEMPMAMMMEETEDSIDY